MQKTGKKIIDYSEKNAYAIKELKTFINKNFYNDIKLNYIVLKSSDNCLCSIISKIIDSPYTSLKDLSVNEIATAIKALLIQAKSDGFNQTDEYFALIRIHKELCILFSDDKISVLSSAYVKDLYSAINSLLLVMKKRVC